MEVKFDVLVCILVFLFSGLGTSIPIPTQTGYQFTSTLPGFLSSIIPTPTAIPNLPTNEPNNAGSGEEDMPPVKPCPSQVDPMWGILWPKTKPGKRIVLPCPMGFIGKVRRRCNMKGKWRPPDFYDCVARNIDGIDSQADAFFLGEPDIDGAMFLVRQLSNVTRRPPRNQRDPFLSRNDLRTVNFVTRETIRLLRRQGSQGQSPEEIIDLFNNVLDTRNQEPWASLQESESGSEELLNNAESFAAYLALELDDSGDNQVRYSRENVIIRADRFSRAEKFSDSQFPTTNDLVNSSNTDTTNSITIPSSYLEARADRDGNISVAYVLFPSLQDFLPNNIESGNVTLGSVIISAQVMTSNYTTNSDIESILKETPIELTFALNISHNSLFENFTIYCAYWNFSTDFNSTSTGGWVSDGIIAEFIDDTTVRCLSSHLTSFSVLVDVTGTFSETNETVDETEILALSRISYIGTSISILCLLATVIYLLTLRKVLFVEIFNFIHLNLACALLLALIVFVAGIEWAAQIEEVCKLVAALLHYLFLSAFCWMLCEAIMLYLLLVVVFSRLAKMWYLYLVIGWGTPVIIVAITLGVEFHDYTNESGICWLKYSNNLIWSFVGPVLAIISMNTLILVIVLVQMYRTRNKRNGREKMGKVTEARDTAKYLIKGAVVLLPLLGITWIVGIFAVNTDVTFFAWLFTILNSFQGVFIFFFHVVTNKRFLDRIKKWYQKRKRLKQSAVFITSKSTNTLSSSLNNSIENIAEDTSMNEMSSKCNLQH